MTFTFQSLNRSHDMGDYAKFVNYIFKTDDPAIAAKVRKNSGFNKEVWELTSPEAESNQPTADSATIPVKRGPGRPPKPKGVVTVRGPRTADVNASSIGE